MNDRFNFRYARREKVYEVLDIDFYTGYIKVFRPNKSERRCTFQYDPDWLLQCTGLKDKNGTLIYENDIVKGVFEDRTLTVVRWSEKDLTWCADFSQVYGKPEYSYYVALADYDSKNLEVIGNVYENPELLEGKND